jgi:hypothetical protein
VENEVSATCSEDPAFGCYLRLVKISFLIFLLCTPGIKRHAIFLVFNVFLWCSSTKHYMFFFPVRAACSAPVTNWTYRSVVTFIALTSLVLGNSYNEYLWQIQLRCVVTSNIHLPPSQILYFIILPSIVLPAAFCSQLRVSTNSVWIFTLLPSTVYNYLRCLWCPFCVNLILYFTFHLIVPNISINTYFEMQISSKSFSPLNSKLFWTLTRILK